MLKSERKKILTFLKSLTISKGKLPESYFDQIRELMSSKIGLNFEMMEDDIYYQHLINKKYFFLEKHPDCQDQFNPDAKTFGSIIEGDNLPILFLLQNTHKEKVDLIYIDPPYNNGNSGFCYNNDYFIKKNERKLNNLNEIEEINKERRGGGHSSS